MSFDFSSPELVSAYDELPLWSAMFGQLLLDEVPMAAVRTLLDVGCGTGFPLIELAERLGPGTEAHGLDTWGAALRRAAEKIATRGVRNVTLHEGSAASMPFGDATFDLIVSNLGLNNFDDRDAAIRECRRVARPGATLVLTTNLVGHMRELYEVFESTLSDADAIQRLRDHVAHRATIPGVTQLLAGAGFTIRRIVEREAVMRFASGTALMQHYFIRLGFLDAWQAVAPEGMPALEEGLNRRGELRLTIPMAYVEAEVR
jgi:ubiquinone/menaquinone biosynthesis C-methylase UbiE